MNEAPRYTATNLSDTLDAKGLKQSWIARQVGISKSLMSKIAAGDRTVDAETGTRIAELVGVPFFLVFELRQRSEMQSQSEAA